MPIHHRPQPRSAAHTGLGLELDSIDERLLEAMRRAVPRLPHDMQQSFAALLSPENLAITGAVLVAWAGSHAVGIGEIVDIGLLAFGLITLGAMAIDVGSHVTEFLRLASGAKTSADLDAAAEHLAEAVAILGVALFTTLVMKHAVKTVRGPQPRLNPTIPARYFALTAEEWLYKSGFRRVAPVARAGTETALRFLEGKRNFASEGNVADWLKGMDLSKPVSVKQFAPGETLIGYLQLNPTLVAKLKANPQRAAEMIKALKPGDVEIGRFFTRSGTSSRQLGIADQNRLYVKIKVQGAVSALESTTCPIKDTWTVRAGGTTTKAGNTWLNGQLVSGGGIQYLIPDSRYLYFPSNTLKIVEIGSKVTLYYR